MSYLSRRVREIKAEDAARHSGIKTTFINTVKAGQIVAGIDWGFSAYELTQRMRESPINFRNRGA